VRTVRAIVFAVFLAAGSLVGILGLAPAAANFADRMQFSEPVKDTLRGVPCGIALAVFCASVFGVIGLALLAAADQVLRRWSVMGSAERVTFFAAVLVGVGISIPFHMILFGFWPWGPPLGLVVMIGLVFLTHAMLASMAEALPWSRVGGRRTNWKVFDTNVLIDGRIYEIAKSGFLEGRLYVPEFVIHELQAISDGHDSHKRQRGRRGLDMLQNLRSDFEIEVGTQDRLAGDPNDAVDNKLIRLALALGASLVTNDYNLNKVAKVQGVRVLNVNDLAMAARIQFLPGESFKVEIEREGSQPGQGVGFLEDGTMVVVEHGAQFIGQRTEVRITQIHQTTAGKMIFASPNGLEHSDAQQQARRRS